jgi:hypothetical protein
MKIVQYSDRLVYKEYKEYSFVFRVCVGNSLQFNGKHKASLEIQSRSDFGIIGIWEI